jgi:glutamate---cysteine ligase / carboxylate-amine ligase
MAARSMGVEEELLLVEAGTGRPLAVAESALEAAEHDKAEHDKAGHDKAGGGQEGRPEGQAEADEASLEFELQRQQLETNSKPCHDLGELSEELRRGRAKAAKAAAAAGARVAALATSPVPVEPELVRKGRYLKMARAFGLTAHEQLTCGCHVHVGISSPDEGVAVLDRIRPWLPVLLALSANSPFWQGLDSGYASFRYQAWSRWPTAGPTDTFGTAEAYQETVRQMVSTGTLLDSGMVYFDARLSEHYPTIEIRIADVCLYADDALLIAALTRGLVETEARRWRSGDALPDQRLELLRLASWRASRSGLDDTLLHPVTGQPETARAAATALFTHVEDALDEAGDTGTVRELLDTVLARGNGAAFQRGTRRDRGLSHMIDAAAEVTAR